MPQEVYLLPPQVVLHFLLYYLHMDFSFLLCRPHIGSFIPVPEAPVGDTQEDSAYEVVSVVYLCYLEDR